MLRATVAMMHQAAPMNGTTIGKNPLKGIQHNVRMGRPSRHPTDNPPSIDIDHEGDISKARPGREIGKVWDAEPV